MPELKPETSAGSVSQVFTNLIMNSIKHGFEGMDKGNIYIEISGEKGQSCDKIQ